MKRYIKFIREWFRNIDPVDIALIMTLILIFTYMEDVLNLRKIVQYVTGGGILLYRYIGRNPWYWLLVTALMAYGHAHLWFSIDNHKYLMSYWSLAITLSLFLKKPESVLKKNAILLIGFCFFFATIWKLITPEYIDGSFFEFLLIGGDSRFESFSMLVTGISFETISQNKEIIQSIAASSDPTLYLQASGRVRVVALFLTWWTVLIEGAIAVLFLLSWFRSSYLDHIKNYVLWIFILSTYPVASVIGFAWLITAMGIAQIKTDNVGLKTGYVLIFILLAFFSERAISYLKFLAGLFYF